MGSTRPPPSMSTKATATTVMTARSERIVRMPAWGLMRRGYSQPMLPSWLTPPIVAIGVAVAASSQEVVTGIVPGLLVAAFTAADYALWRKRGRPWHDRDVIVLLLPPLACAVWIGV